MDIEFLACPGCGSEMFVFNVLNRKIVFRVTTSCLPVVISEGGNGDAGLIDLARFHCGACSWAGGLRALVSSHG